MLGVWTIYWRVKAPTPGGGKVRLIWPLQFEPLQDEDDEAMLMALLLSIEELM